MSDRPLAIVGLGNPGAEYASTRHNAGYWLVDSLARDSGLSLTADSKLSGKRVKARIGGHDVWLFEPTTFMNMSGRSMRRLMDYYRLPSGRILVVHDELDLPPGIARFKSGGGHGGHNGLRDIVAHCGRDFMRLRIGIGHPGHKDAVVSYVLKPPRREELDEIEVALDAAERSVRTLFEKGLEAATHELHTRLRQGKQNETGAGNPQ
jgi:PTH1 family peptidyl-tRNA hydrolase